MAIVGSIFLILLGVLALFVAGAMLSVRDATNQFFNGFPPLVRSMMLDSDPKVKKSLETIERLPLFAAITAAVASLVFIGGLVLLHNLIAQIVLFVLVLAGSILFWFFRDKLTALLKQQFMDQMKKKQAEAPRPTPAQARDQFRSIQERARAQANSAPPTNRSQRRAAQRKK